MKKILFLLALLTISFSTCFSQSGWIQYASGTSNSIYDIQFTDINTGYAVTRNGFTLGTIIKSTNGGVNWTTIYSPVNFLPFGIIFMNATTGTVVGSGNSNIQKTTNGGLTWYLQENSYNDGFSRIIYLNSNTGIAAGYDYIIRTTNAGNNWTSTLTVNEAYFTDIAFINSLTGFCVGGSCAMTTNGGLNWVGFPGLNFYPISIINFGENNLLACGGNSIEKSTNGGLNFTNVYTGYNGPNYSNLNCIRYSDNNNAVCVGDSGRILNTTNNGESWHLYNRGILPFNHVFFINPSTGWICGTGGVILKTTNGGITTETEPISSIVPNEFSLSQNYPNPFNPSTNINYDIPTSGLVTLKVFNISGKEIETLVNQNQVPGSYSVTFTASNYPSGVYFYKLMTEGFSETKKMLLVK